jgi:selenocysteine lyase/cysteine desulfurase
MNENERLVCLRTQGEAVLARPFVAADDAEEKAFRRILQERTIGRDAEMDTPFGRKRIIYFDFTASGRLFRDIEDELNEKALPFMANTHTESTYTGRLMTHLCHQAQERIAAYTNAGPEDVVIFAESGCTGAVNKMIRVLGIRLPDQLEERYSLRSRIPDEARPVIFTSLMEHHSNDIAWRETIGDVVYVGFDTDGRISLKDLDSKLCAYAGRPFRIGAFSAGSNVTGMTSDTYEIAKVLHRHGALAFFDFAAAGPYLPIDMNPRRDDDPETRLAYKDAVFISTHKFVGGPRTPGILIAKKPLFTNKVPTTPGGGTVLYTSPWGHRYLPDIQARESGGTPPILQIIQAGLVFDLKERIGSPRMLEIEHDYLRRAREAWSRNPEITILGRGNLEGLGIVSIIVRGAHHNLVTSMLNDLYGIQARAGCMCAGPYGHELLGIDRTVSTQIQEQLRQGKIGVKPGWIRFSFSPITSEEDFQALLEAVDFVSRNWRKFESKYRLCMETGEFAYVG